MPALGVMAGALVIQMSFLKLGNLINKVPECVVQGFTGGIAIVISLQQIPYALGTTKADGDRTVAVAIGTINKTLDLGINWQSSFVVAATLLIKFDIVRIVEAFKLKM